MSEHIGAAGGGYGADAEEPTDGTNAASEEAEASGGGPGEEMTGEGTGGVHALDPEATEVGGD